MHPIAHLLESLPPLILGSGSSSRQAVLTEIGVTCQVERPDVDERAFDQVFQEAGPHRYAAKLAKVKGYAVAKQFPEHLVLSADQVGVLWSTPPQLLTKQSTVEGAVQQLMDMSGTTHSLINALALTCQSADIAVAAEQEISVTMRSFSEPEARHYVERFEPFESAGSYRIEDQALMDPLEAFIVSVVENDESGVRGLPLSVLASLLSEFAEQWQ